MRLYEVHGFKALGSDDLITEGVMDSIKKAVGSKIDQHVSVVRNTSDALVVLYKVGTDPKFLDTATFLMKKKIKGIIKSLGGNPIATKISQMINKVWPQGRSLLDFIKSVCIVGVMNLVRLGVEKVKDAVNVVDRIKDSAKEEITNAILAPVSKLVNLETAIDQLSNASGIFTILKTLGVADVLIFDDLSQVNKKIVSAPGGNL